jgi:hypothetical protein
MVGLGRPSVGELSRDDLVVPPGFERRLGEDVPSPAQSVPSQKRAKG